MLSHTKIEQRVRDGEIRIAYSFLPNDKGEVLFVDPDAPVDLDKPDSAATRFFQSRLFSDRLGVTLGPVVRSHSPLAGLKRPKFRGLPDTTDIRDSAGVLALQPFETVSVASNEHITLGGKTAAMIIPRITNADAGIILAPTYIDAYWSGTLQMVLTNATQHIQHLRLIEPIAQCFFFALGSAVDPAFKQRFPSKSHHFGQNWHKVLREDGDPFPRRKRLGHTPGPIPRARLAVIRFWEENRSWVVALGLVGAVVTAAVGYGRIAQQISTLAKDGETVAQHTHRLQSLEDRIPLSGIQRTAIPTGRVFHSLDFTIDRPLSASTTIWVEAYAPAAPDATAVGSLSTGTNSRQTSVHLTVTIPSTQPADTPVEIHWMLAP